MAEEAHIGTGSEYVFEGPDDEVLARTLEHENGDLTIRGPGGRLRLPAGGHVWTRYRGYLDERGIETIRAR